MIISFQVLDIPNKGEHGGVIGRISLAEKAMILFGPRLTPLIAGQCTLGIALLTLKAFGRSGFGTRGHPIWQAR